jgi:hypothetical protein
MEEQQKRKAEEADGEGSASKRQRVENGSSGDANGGPSAPAAPRRLGIDLDVLQKTKLALQKQKELAERLKKAGIKVRAAPPLARLARLVSERLSSSQLITMSTPIPAGWTAWVCCSGAPAACT